MSYSTILVPVVPGRLDDARRAIEAARPLLAPGGRITVLTVFDDTPVYLTIETYGMNPPIQADEEPLGAAMKEELTADDVEVVVRRGHPTRAIIDLAEEQGAECIVIAASQPGWKQIFLGSTAAGVVRHAHCSVLVLRQAPAHD